MMKYIFIWFLKISINFEPFFTQNMMYINSLSKKWIAFFIFSWFVHYLILCVRAILYQFLGQILIYNILGMDQIMTHPVLLGIVLLLLLLLSGELLMLSSVGLELRFYLFDIYIDTSMRKHTKISIVFSC